MSSENSSTHPRSGRSPLETCTATAFWPSRTKRPQRLASNPKNLDLKQIRFGSGPDFPLTEIGGEGPIPLPRGRARSESYFRGLKKIRSSGQSASLPSRACLSSLPLPETRPKTPYSTSLPHLPPWLATSEEEQAVSEQLIGPRRPKTWEILAEPSRRARSRGEVGHRPRRGRRGRRGTQLLHVRDGAGATARGDGKVGPGP